MPLQTDTRRRSSSVQTFELRVVRPTFPDKHGWFVTVDYDFPDGSGNSHEILAARLTQEEACDFVLKWQPLSKRDYIDQYMAETPDERMEGP
jgi:hypothetical protein